MGGGRLALPPGDACGAGVRAARAPTAAEDADAAEVVLLDLQRVHDDGGTGYAARRRRSRSARTAAGSHGRSTSRATRSTPALPRPRRPAPTSTRSCRAPTTRRLVGRLARLPLRRPRRRLPALSRCGGTSSAPRCADDVLVLEDHDERLELELHASRSGPLGGDLAARARASARSLLLPDVRRDRDAAARAPARARASSTSSSTRRGTVRAVPTGSSSSPTSTPPSSAWRGLRSSDPSAWTPLLAEDPAQRVWGVDAFAARRTCSRCVATVRRWCASSTARGTAYDVAARARRRDGAPRPQRRLGRDRGHRGDRLVRAPDAVVRPRVGRLAHGAAPQRERVRGRPDAYVCERLPGAGSRRRRRAGDRRAAPGHTARRHRAVPALRLRLLRGACDPDWGIDWWRSLPSLLDRGAVFAVGHPRGGGEMGRRWWEDGHLAAKHHTFDDQAAVGGVPARRAGLGRRRRAGCRRAACSRARSTRGVPSCGAASSPRCPSSTS